MYPISSLEDTRTAIRKVAGDLRVTVTGMTDAAKISRGVINRFINNNTELNNGREADIRLSSLLRLLNYAGYELVVRKKDNRTQREHRRRVGAS